MRGSRAFFRGGVAKGRQHRREGVAAGLSTVTTRPRAFENFRCQFLKVRCCQRHQAWPLDKLKYPAWAMRLNTWWEIVSLFISIIISVKWMIWNLGREQSQPGLKGKSGRRARERGLGFCILSSPPRPSPCSDTLPGGWPLWLDGWAI